MLASLVNLRQSLSNSSLKLFECLARLLAIFIAPSSWKQVVKWLRSHSNREIIMIVIQDRQSFLRLLRQRRLGQWYAAVLVSIEIDEIHLLPGALLGF